MLQWLRWLGRHKPKAGRCRKWSSRFVGVEVLEHRELLTCFVSCADHDGHDQHSDDHHDHQDEIVVTARGSYYIDDGFVIDDLDDHVGHSEHTEPDGHSTSSEVGASLPPPIDIDDVPVYHSNPDADQKIYLDFNGHRVSGTGWNDNNDGRVIVAPAFDNDGDSTTFSSAEQSAIRRIWQRVAEDFAPFDLDVTTEAPSSRDFRIGRKAIRVLISSNIDEATGNRWFDTAGGVAYIGSWRWRSDTPVWVFENNLGGQEKRISEAASHEIGHAFGLHHDGIRGGEEYFEGHGSGRTGWAPIMGAGYSRQVTQWDRGEYENSDNRENDLSIIASSANAISYRADDYSSSRSRAHRLESTDGQLLEASGLIHRSSDRDMFVFETGQGEVDFDIDGVRYGSNLDLMVSLYADDGTLLEEFNPISRLNVDINIELDAGEYYLEVEGVGFGDPAEQGYSSYGSLGQYNITGRVVETMAAAATPLVAVAEARQAALVRWNEEQRARLEMLQSQLAIAIEQSDDGSEKLMLIQFLIQSFHALG